MAGGNGGGPTAATNCSGKETEANLHISHTSPDSLFLLVLHHLALHPCINSVLDL